MAKADLFLKQMSTISVDAAPAAIIHLAYYAMLHAATAVLLDRIGDVPKTHAGTIGRFSQLVRETEAGRAFARALNQAEKQRMISDYDDEPAPEILNAAPAIDRHRLRRLLPLAALM